jgi:hypothetical protein
VARPEGEVEILIHDRYHKTKLFKMIFLNP